MTERPETGPMKFGDDWTGVFVRGDDALGAFVPALEWAIKILDRIPDGSFQEVIFLAHVKWLREGSHPPTTIAPFGEAARNA